MRKKSFCLIAVLAMLFCFTTSCGDGFVDYDSNGIITGKVIDLDTQDPISGVLVSLNPHSSDVYTGYDGSFEFVGLTADHYDVMAHKEGYSTDYKSVTIIAGGVVNITMAIKKKE